MITGAVLGWAKRTPEKPAVIYNGHRLSYAVFAALIGRARGFFRAAGFVGPGTAGLAIRNLLDFWVFSLALRSLGMTTVVAASARELQALGIPDMRVVFTGAGESWPDLDEAAAALNVPLVVWSLAETPDWTDVTHPPGGHILLTSGTTGANKMVLMSANVDAQFLRRNAELFGLRADSLMSVFNFQAWTGVGYRVAACPWVVGGATLIQQGGERHMPLLHPDLTHAAAVPVTLREILAAPVDAFQRRDDVQFIVTGGAMTRAQVEKTKARITSQLINLLSSSEGSSIAMTRLDTEEDHRWQRVVPGRDFEIVDEHDTLVPLGETGRIRVAIAGGPDCYLHNPEATRAFFRDGFFYPGDLATMRADGRLALQGRVTDVINIQGGKFMPADIEERLIDDLGVTGVVLFSMQNAHGEEQIYVVIERGEPVAPDTLKAVLTRELSGFHQVNFAYMRDLPRTHTGKIVREKVREQLVRHIAGT